MVGVVLAAIVLAAATALGLIVRFLRQRSVKKSA
jgi:hypothetical protein